MSRISRHAMSGLPGIVSVMGDGERGFARRRSSLRRHGGRSPAFNLGICVVRTEEKRVPRFRILMGQQARQLATVHGKFRMKRIVVLGSAMDVELPNVTRVRPHRRAGPRQGLQKSPISRELIWS